jgi:hypothetical protein
MVFSMYMRFRWPSCGISFNMCAVMRSMPGALYGFNSLISFLSLRRVKACRCSGGWVCDASSFSTSGSCMLSYGVNTSERCFSKSSTFSLSLLVHGPGGMEFVRIGGSIVLYCIY